MGTKKKGRKQSGKKSVKKRRGRFWRILLWIIGGYVAFSVLLTLAYRWVNPPITPLMVIRSLEGEPRVKEWKDLSEISPKLVQAAVASEDNRFCGHHGFDFSAIQRAIDHNKKYNRKRTTQMLKYIVQGFIYTKTILFGMRY